MKTLLTFLFCALSSVAFAQTQPPVGSITENQNFTIYENGQLRDADFSAYDDRILVVMMMTPWCPICQTNSRAVGEGITKFYAKSSRKKLKNKNKSGIKIATVMLSTETGSEFDRQNISFSKTNGFKQWGVDSETNRANSTARRLLAYYRGGAVNSNDLNDWGNDRRRVVVINLTRNSTTHAYGQILLNQNQFTSVNAASARKAIDAVKRPKK